MVPADGLVREGESGFDESLMTGEDRPVTRGLGDAVMAGSVNVSQPVTISVSRRAGSTALDSILRLAEKSHSHKPRISHLAELVSRWFVLGVILLAAGVAGFGLWSGNPAWLPTTIAVLVVTCPCALSLATPLALSAGASSLVQRGVHVTRGHALETLNRIDHVVFDKTGTLTRGQIVLDDTLTPAAINTDEAIADRSVPGTGRQPPPGETIDRGRRPTRYCRRCHASKHSPGGGISGRIDGHEYRLGSSAFVTGNGLPDDQVAGQHWRNGPRADPWRCWRIRAAFIAAFRFRDEIRPGAPAHWSVTWKTDGTAVSLLSGDRTAAVSSLGGCGGYTRLAGGAPAGPETGRAG